MPEYNRELLDDNLMNIIKEVFYYGCYSAKDFENIYGIKSSSFSRYKNFLKYVFGNYLEEIKLENGKKALHMRVDEFEMSYNILLDLFNMKKIAEVDFVIFLKLMYNLLENSEKSFKVSEICDILNIEKASDERIFRRKIISFENYGYLFHEMPDKRSYVYKLNENILDTLDNETLYSLSCFVNLCRNIYHPAVCGHYLLYNLSVINSCRNIDFDNIFLCKHLHMGQVLEDGKLWTVLAAIYERQPISLKNKGKVYVNLQPHKIIINETDGRRYVFCINLENGRNNGIMYRFDRISDIKTEKNPPPLISEEEADIIYNSLFEKSFIGSCIFKKKFRTGTLIYKRDFYYEIKKYFPNAVPEQADEFHDKINIEVNDLNELKPWLRYNLGKVKLTDTSDSTAEDFEKELQEWRAMYGVS